LTAVRNRKVFPKDDFIEGKVQRLGSERNLGFRRRRGGFMGDPLGKQIPRAGPLLIEALR